MKRQKSRLDLASHYAKILSRADGDTWDVVRVPALGLIQAWRRSDYPQDTGVTVLATYRHGRLTEFDAPPTCDSCQRSATTEDSLP